MPSLTRTGNLVSVLTWAQALAAASLCTTLLAPRAALAAPTFYDFSCTPSIWPGLPEIGAFSGRFEVDGGFIIGITGSGANVGTITSLFAAGTATVNANFPPNDNVFDDQSPWLSEDGVSFAATQFAVVNLYLQAPGQWGVLYKNGDNIGSSIGLLSVNAAQAVPEPAGMALAGLALAALALTRRRA